MIKKPLLAEAVEDVNSLKFPLLASPKLDGIRAMVVEGRLVTRKFKQVPNEYIRKELERFLPEGIDGELMAGDTFQACSSAVMSRDGEPTFTYHVFDLVGTPSSAKLPFQVRLEELRDWHGGLGRREKKLIQVVAHEMIYDQVDLMRVEANWVDRAGYEGVMLRSPTGWYKFGRSTLREGILMKLKRFVDAEAVIVGVEELEKNTNEAFKGELGQTKRSSAKAGKVGAGTLGTFVVVPLSKMKKKKVEPGVYKIDWNPEDEFRVGTGDGLTARLRQELWEQRDKLYNKVIKYKYQAHGVKDKPRFPVFLGFRDASDL